MLKMILDVKKGFYILRTDNYRNIARLNSYATDIKVLNNPEPK